MEYASTPGDSAPDPRISVRPPFALPPVALGSLIGRDRELDELERRVEEHRLVTVTGPGGVGKTRLCVALAERLAARGNRCVWVGLGAVDDADHVPMTTAGALGARPGADSDPLRAACETVGASPAVVVLDNCEHVVDAAAALAEQMLGACPRLRFVATSRAVLGLVGEAVHRLDGLAVESSDGWPSPAVELFIDRGRIRVPGFGSAGDLAAAQELCRRLDGLPLAVELAAARVDALSIIDIAAHLDNGLRVLHRAGRGPERHSTLDAALAWSYDLLCASERTALRRLAVFRGTLSVPAAEAILSAPTTPALAVDDVVENLSALVDQSLLQPSRVDGEPRYRLLETVSTFARGRLADDPAEYRTCEQAHTAFYMQLAHTAHLGQSGPDQQRWIARLELEHDNLRAALRRTLAPGSDLDLDPESGGRLAGLLWPFWYRHGHYREGRHWLDRALSLGGQSDGVRLQLLLGAGTLAFLRCDYSAAEARLDDAAALANTLGDLRSEAQIAQRRGSIARETGRYRDAALHHNGALEIWRTLADARQIAVSLDYLGFAEWMAGDLAAGEAHSRCAVAATSESFAGQQEHAAAMITLAGILLDQGNALEARGFLTMATDIAHRLDYREGLAWSSQLKGIDHLAGGGVASAIAAFAVSLAIHAELGDKWRMASVLDNLAEALSAASPSMPTTAAADAAVFAVAADSIRGRIGAPVPAIEACRAAAVRARITAAPPASVPHTSVLVARAQAIADEWSALVPNRPALTEREQAVLALLGQGLTNRQIGATLYISTSTAGVHVSNILRKIGATNRTQAAAIAASYQASAPPRRAPSAPQPASASFGGRTAR